MTSRRRFVSRLCAHTFLSSVLDEQSVVVDLGLNQGQFARGISERFGCRVYGVEPVPELFEALKSQHNLVADNCAIGTAAGTDTINVFAGRCASMAEALPGEDARVVTVETIPFPDFLARHHLRRVDLLKVDIEGAELEMIAHLPAPVLSEIRQITIEFHDFIYPETAAAVREAMETLHRAGFLSVRFSKDNQDILFFNARSFPNPAWLRLLLHFWHRPRLAITRKLRRLFGNLNPDHF